MPNLKEYTEKNNKMIRSVILRYAYCYFLSMLALCMLKLDYPLLRILGYEYHWLYWLITSIIALLPFSIAMTYKYSHLPNDR